MDLKDRTIVDRRIEPSLEFVAAPDGLMSVTCLDCSAGLDSVTGVAVEQWTAGHAGCPVVVEAAHVEAWAEEVRRAQVEAHGIVRRAFAAYNERGVRHWSRLSHREQAAWLTWVADGAVGEPPQIDVAADAAEAERVDAYLDANPDALVVGELRTALRLVDAPVPVVPPVPEAVRDLVVRFVAAAAHRVPLAHVAVSESYVGDRHRRIAEDLLDAIAAPLYRAWLGGKELVELTEPQLLEYPTWAGSDEDGSWTVEACHNDVDGPYVAVEAPELLGVDLALGLAGALIAGAARATEDHLAGQASTSVQPAELPTCEAPGDQEHDHAMCEDVVADRAESGTRVTA